MNTKTLEAIIELKKQLQVALSCSKEGYDISNNDHSIMLCGMGIADLISAETATEVSRAAMLDDWLYTRTEQVVSHSRDICSLVIKALRN